MAKYWDYINGGEVKLGTAVEDHVKGNLSQGDLFILFQKRHPGMTLGEARERMNWSIDQMKDRLQEEDAIERGYPEDL